MPVNVILDGLLFTHNQGASGTRFSRWPNVKWKTRSRYEFRIYKATTSVDYSYAGYANVWLLSGVNLENRLVIAASGSSQRAA